MDNLNNTIDLKILAKTLRRVIDPSFKAFEEKGIHLVEYTFRRQSTSEIHDVHVFHLKFGPDITDSEVRSLVLNEFGGSGAYVQVDFTSIQGRATAVLIF